MSNCHRIKFRDGKLRSFSYSEYLRLLKLRVNVLFRWASIENNVDGMMTSTNTLLDQMKVGFVGLFQ